MTDFLPVLNVERYASYFSPRYAGCAGQNRKPVMSSIRAKALSRVLRQIAEGLSHAMVHLGMPTGRPYSASITVDLTIIIARLIARVGRQTRLFRRFCISHASGLCFLSCLFAQLSRRLIRFGFAFNHVGFIGHPAIRYGRMESIDASFTFSSSSLKAFCCERKGNGQESKENRSSVQHRLILLFSGYPACTILTGVIQNYDCSTKTSFVVKAEVSFTSGLREGRLHPMLKEPRTSAHITPVLAHATQASECPTEQLVGLEVVPRVRFERKTFPLGGGVILLTTIKSIAYHTQPHANVTY